MSHSIEADLEDSKSVLPWWWWKCSGLNQWDWRHREVICSQIFHEEGEKRASVCLCSSINNTAVRKRFFFIQNENMRTTERKYINFHQHSYFCNLLCKLLDPWVGHAARWHWVFFTVMENSDLQAVHHNETKIGSLLGQTLESLHWKKATNFCSQVCKHF